MADNLPEPESRREQYLAKAAGEDVTVPTPASREELFLNAIAQGGGGGGGTTYTAGTGIDITGHVISVDDAVVQGKLTAGTNITISDNVISSTASGPTVVQTTGSSTTDVMSQKAVTDIIGDVESTLHTLNYGSEEA